MCNCSVGFEGLHCNGDMDDCAGDPCIYPYVCVDLVNSYSCECPSDNPECDGLEGWMIGAIVFSCVLLVVIIATICVIWAVRKG